VGSLSAVWRLAIPLSAYLAMVLGLHVFHNAWVAFGFYHGAILAIVMAHGKPGCWRELFIGWEWRLGSGSIAFGLGGGVLLFLLAPYADINSSNIEPILERLGLQGNLWLLFVIYHSLVNPWFEELFWRGFLVSDKKHPVLNDILFAGYHALVLVLFLDLVWIGLAMVILTLAGWLWRQIRRQRKGLLLPVVSHMSADTSIMAVVYWISVNKIGF